MAVATVGTPATANSWERVGRVVPVAATSRERVAEKGHGGLSGGVDAGVGWGGLVALAIVATPAAGNSWERVGRAVLAIAGEG